MSELSILVILGVVTALIVVYAIRLRAVPMPS
ncbi:MAG TPA: SAM-dependent methyltransferase, partial [Thalassospira sp.]|nr:SAM-dependent methyltransferase [Thalassospira sp.]